MSEVRLIDANALKDSAYINKGNFNTVEGIRKWIDNAPTIDFEKLGESLRCQIRAEYGSCDDCELSCPRNELIKLLGLDRPQGEWENDSDNLPICNKCGEIALQRIFVKMPHLIQDVRMVRSNYCPNCGAKMQKGGAE